MKEAEKAVLSEKLSALQAELSTAALELERLSRETALLRDQERVRKLHHSQHQLCFHPKLQNWNIL